jgi:hypothetical protein
MHRTLCTLAALLICSFCSLATNVSGYIGANTTWTKANSPYVVKGNIDIDTGATLTIDPGVHILFDGNYVIYVDGKIRMQGTAVDSIFITSNKSIPAISDYSGIDIRNSTSKDTFLFDYCHFSYAGAGIFVRNIAAKITNCVFDYCGNGVYNGYATTSYTYIYNCRFNYNNAGLYTNGATTVTNSLFMHSTLWGIYVNTWHSANYASHNVFIDNPEAIVKCTNVFYNTITNCNNTGLRDCGNISYNQIWNCKTGITGGVNISHNGVEYNDVGLMRVYTTTYVHYNCIAHNKTLNLKQVNSNIDVSNNYWGIIDSAKIADSIYDFYDDFISGKAMFIPFLNSPDSGCADTISLPDTTHTPTRIPIVGTQQTICVYPNPVISSFTIDAGTEAIQEVFIYNTTGSLVFQTTIHKNKLELDASSFPNGIYMYKVRLSDKSIIIGKVLKE